MKGNRLSPPHPGQDCHHPILYFLPFRLPYLLLPTPSPGPPSPPSPPPPIADVSVPYPSPPSAFGLHTVHFTLSVRTFPFSLPPPTTRRPHVFTPSYRPGAMTSHYLPLLLVSVTDNVPTPDDSSVTTLPTGQVDYLSHQWREEDVWSSWKNMTRQKNAIANGSRLENASWRTWWKQRNKLKTISPETLNWSVSFAPRFLEAIADFVFFCCTTL